MATCAWALPASASTYYVAPHGDDAAAGTETAPYRTIQRAANQVSPGDTVIVEDGVYTAGGVATPCGSRPVVCVTRGGTAAAWVTFKARHPGGARIDGQSYNTADGFVLRRGSYVAIEGFEIYAMGITGGVTNSAHGVTIQYGHDIRLSQLHIHHIGRTCTDTRFGQDGVFVQVPRVTITRSVFHDIGRLAPGEQACRPATNYYQNHDHGIYVSGERANAQTPGAADVEITNNIFYRHERGWAVQLSPGPLSGISILNNTFAFPNPYRRGHIIVNGLTLNTRIENNIFYRPLGAAIEYTRGLQIALRVQHNVVADAAILNSAPPGTLLSANLRSDPMFRSSTVEPYDFRLLGNSPALGAGLRLDDVSVDFEGNSREAGAYDIGAYQAIPVRPRLEAAPPRRQPARQRVAGADERPAFSP